MYLFLKYLHILSAIVAVGTTFTYGLWFALASKSRANYGFVLESVGFIDSRLATPAYLVLLISGLALVYAGNWPFSLLWIWGSLTLYAIATVLGLFIAQSLLRRQIEALKAQGPESPEVDRLAAQGRRLGPVMLLITLAILYFMIVKPGA